MSVKLACRRISLIAATVCLSCSLPTQAAQNTWQTGKFSSFAQDRGNSDSVVELLERCYRSSGQEALEACDRALQIKTDDPTTWTNRGVVLEELGQVTQAVTSHEQALEFDPDYSLALTNHCAALIALNRYNQALNSCQAALAGDGRWGDKGSALGWYNLALAFDRLDRIEEAENAYNRALELKPDYGAALNNLGLIWEKTGRLEDALAAYEQAADFDPGNEMARTNIEIVRDKLR